MIHMNSAAIAMAAAEKIVEGKQDAIAEEMLAKITAAGYNADEQAIGAIMSKFRTSLTGYKVAPDAQVKDLMLNKICEAFGDALCFAVAKAGLEEKRVLAVADLTMEIVTTIAVRETRAMQTPPPPQQQQQPAS